MPYACYGVAIEWDYYPFILLTPRYVLLALVSGQFAEGNNVVGWRNLTVAARIAYPLCCVGVVLIHMGVVLLSAARRGPPRHELW
ncbi:hypothetical protein [Streptomyces huasconensis]|uniref:hypothetical protein n=1 Tax=Streptomyces huasconensis TaxID=1854574 RepID=UPI0033F1755F